MRNVYNPPLMPCGTQNRAVERGPPFGCAEREAGVGSMRVRMTFLWMSDSTFLLRYSAFTNRPFVPVVTRHMCR